MSTEVEFESTGHTVIHEGNGLIKVSVEFGDDKTYVQNWMLEPQYIRSAFVDNLMCAFIDASLDLIQETLPTIAKQLSGPKLIPVPEGNAPEDLVEIIDIKNVDDFNIVATLRRENNSVIEVVWKLDPSYCNAEFVLHLPSILLAGGIDIALSFLHDCATVVSGPFLEPVVGTENFLADIAKRMFGFLKPSGKGKGFKYPTDEEIKRAGSAYKALEDKAKQTILNDAWLEKNIAGTEVTIKMPFGTVDEFVSAVQRATSDVTKFAALSSTTQSAIESLCSRVDTEAKKFFDKNGVDYTTDNSLTNFIEKEVKKFNTSKTVCDFYKPKWQDVLGNVFVYTAPKDKKGGLVDGSIGQTVNAESKTYKDVTLTLTVEDVKKLATALLALDKAFVVKDELYVGEHFDNYDYLSGEYYDSQSYAIDMLWDAVFDQYWWEFVEPVIESTLEVDKLLIDVIGKSVK